MRLSILFLFFLSLFAPSSAAWAEGDGERLCKLMRCDRVHAAGYTGKGITVAVIDTGYDFPDFPLRAWHDDVDGGVIPVDLGRGPDGIHKKFGHGTMVAGCVHLTAPEADLVAVRYDGTREGLARSIRWVSEHRRELNIRVLNLSITGGSSPEIWSAVRQAYNQGIVVVASMGNNGPLPDGGACPGNIPEVLTVGGAFDATTVWESSSRGPTSEGSSKPDLCAPADSIVTWMTPGNHFDDFSKQVQKIRELEDEPLKDLYRADPSRYSAWKKLPTGFLTLPNAAELLRASLPRWFPIDAHHVKGDGTSLSCPLVSGIVATMLQASPGATPGEITDVLKKSARPMEARFGPNDAGTGFVDANSAIRVLLSRKSRSSRGPS